jgi:DNA-binding response OmpR family regulator
LTELMARTRAIIRRGYGGASEAITIDGLTVDTAIRRVWRDGAEIALTAREFAILELLIRRRGALVRRAEFYEHIYDGDTDILSNTIDVHVGSLRRKLAVSIRTRRGEGYILDA